jgi:hypothetical protein
VDISYVPFRKIELGRKDQEKDQWLHRQLPPQPLPLAHHEKGDKANAEPPKFARNPNPSNILDATLFKSIF